MSDPSLEKYASIQHLPPRNFRVRWLQIHLSTAVVLMFVAMLLLWANIGHLKTVTIDYDVHGGDVADWIPYHANLRSLGWPMLFCGGRKTHYVMSTTIVLTDTSTQAVPLIVDILVACSIFVGSMFACEYLIRRRKANFPEVANESSRTSE